MLDDPATESTAIHATTKPGGFVNSVAWVFRNRQRWQRIKSNIDAYDQELQCRADGANLSKIRSVLKGAREALEARDVDGAWKCFNCACRLELLYLRPEQLAAAATAIRSEASKLDGWRKEAVLNLLEDNQKGELSERVFLAARIRDEHYDNEAYKDSLRRKSSTVFAITLLLAAPTLLGLSWWKHLPPTGGDQVTMLLSVAMFGLLGATISATLAAVQQRGASRIPELVSSYQVTFLRPFMGPASAIVLYFVAKSTLFGQIFKFPPTDDTLPIVAVAAGFSERLVLRVVETIAGKG
jgi:hypothetical protein